MREEKYLKHAILLRSCFYDICKTFSGIDVYRLKKVFIFAFSIIKSRHS